MSDLARSFGGDNDDTEFILRMVWKRVHLSRPPFIFAKSSEKTSSEVRNDFIGFSETWDINVTIRCL